MPRDLWTAIKQMKGAGFDKDTDNLHEIREAMGTDGENDFSTIIEKLSLLDYIYDKTRKIAELCSRIYDGMMEILRISKKERSDGGLKTNTTAGQQHLQGDRAGNRDGNAPISGGFVRTSGDFPGTDARRRGPR